MTFRTTLREWQALPDRQERFNPTGSLILELRLCEKSARMPGARRLMARAWLRQSNTLRSNGHAYLAVAACEKALRLDPANPDVHYHLALNLKSLNRHAEAAACFENVLARRPSDPSATHLLNALKQRTPSIAPRGYVNQLFDRFSDSFDRRMNGLLNYRVPKLLKKRLRRIIGRRKPFEKVLDLGCGTGLTGHALRPYSKYVKGVDISRKMLQRAAEKSVYDSVVCDDIHHHLYRETDRFDLVVAADVFIYIGDLSTIFRLVVNCLRPEGLFAFSTEKTRRAPFVLRRSGRFAHCPDYIQELSHHHRFTVKTMETTGIRMEGHHWVNGNIFVLQRPPREREEQYG